jgi:hypothetical protein
MEFNMNIDWLASFLEQLEQKEMASMPLPELEFANSLIGIVEKYGKLSNNDGKGIWVGYTPAAENDNAEIGVMCKNCYLRESENTCKIVAQEIELGGLCRLAAIPDGLVTQDGRK